MVRAAGDGREVRALWVAPGAVALVELARRGAGPKVRVDAASDHDEATAHRDEMTVLIDDSPNDALLDAPRLTDVITLWAGVSPALRAQMRARPHLRLHNAHHNAPFVAQHALALLLACASCFVDAVGDPERAQRDPQNGTGLDAVPLAGKRCLLIGFGAIGRRFATMVEAIGMNVSVVRRSGRHERFEAYGPERLTEAVSDADAIVVSLPLTPETEGLLGDEAIRAMKPEAIVVNVGRGPVIDQDALFEALSEGRIRAAGLDVWWRYPADRVAPSRTLPADRPFHELPTVVMSPHRADHVDALGASSAREVAAALRAIARGEDRNIVDVARGY